MHVWTCALYGALVAPALSAAAAVVDAPVTQVTVYSDRARVTRSASVKAGGDGTVDLPLLPQNVDLASIRVDVTGAQLQRVDIARVSQDEVPVDEARRLLEQLEQLSDRIQKASEERQAHHEAIAALAAIKPELPPADSHRAAPTPTPSGAAWTAAFNFAATRIDALQAKVRAYDVQLRDLERERQLGLEKASLLGGARRQAGVKVTPVLKGGGAATVSLSYVVPGARWYPTYDLQLLPESSKVQLSFSGLVSQETGEDWNLARMVLSTAEPAQAVKVPELSTWKLGERDRFIPTPAPVREAVRPPPPANPEPRPRDESQQVAAQLRASAGELANRRAVAQTGDLALDRTEADEESPNDAYAADKKEGRYPARPHAPPPMPAQAAPGRSVDRDEPELEEALSAGQAYESSVDASPMTESIQVASRTSSTRKPSAPSVPFSLSAPGGYVRPRHAADLPASRAGGYDLTFPSLRAESVASGKGARRVALFTETWPVSVERKVYPALAKESYLVAELKSPSSRVLPGGRAQLFVGADPSGTADLALVAPGESFTLPLGLDRAVRPVRNVKVVQSEKGVFGKDDISEYVVTTEVANPYPQPISLRVLDQWPITSDEDVEVTLIRTQPSAIQDKAKGSLEWRITIPPRQKGTVSFTYSIRRPKGWRMHQQQVAR